MAPPPDRPPPVPIDPRPRLLSRWLEAAGPLVVALWLLGVLAALWLAYRWLDPTPDKHLVIATGPEQGAYAEFAQRYLPALRAQGLSVTLRPTDGSAENLALLHDPASGVQAAFVQGGAPDNTAPGAGDPTAPDDLVSLGSVAYEPLWIFYRPRTAEGRPGNPPVERLAQLAGWRLHTGPEGGGVARLLGRLLAANGLPPQAQQLIAGPTVEGVVALVEGRVDGLAMVSAADAPLVQYLLHTPDVSLVPLVQAQAYARQFAYLRALTLPRGMVDLAADQPPRDLPLVATTASLVARADLHPALVQLLVQAARTAHEAPGWFHAAGELPSPRTDAWPLSPEAERFYREGRPWLQRYLPFWLANFVDRMWIVVLPLLAALVPLSRVVPPLVAQRLRARVYRWYAHLRAIERAAEEPGADLDALRARLEQIDRQVEQIGLPLSFTNELYQLRAHINLVRKRLQAGAAPPAVTA